MCVRFLSLAIVVGALGGMPRTMADPVSDIVDQVGLEEFQEYLSVLTGVVPIPGSMYALQNRWSHDDDIWLAGQWIQTRFAAAGLDAEMQVYDSTYGPNIVGELPGLSQPEQIYVICGHYDTYHAGDQYHAPGCDDNGSGTAAVMIAARLLGGYRFDATLRFIAFSGEEQWMVGSQAYCEEAQEQGDQILGAINLDMFIHPSFDNYEPDPDHDLDIGANAASSWLLDFIAARMDTYADIDYQLHVSDQFVSNQWAFWQFGYDAIGLIENTPNEIWGGSNDAYHELTDVMTNPDYEWDFAIDTVRGAVAALIDLGGLLGAPADVNCDGGIDAFDIDPFVLALTDAAGYAAAYPDCHVLLADINNDGVVNVFDIDPFIAKLTGP